VLQRIPPKFLRFFAVGGFTTLVCWGLYEVLYAVNLHPNYRASAAWCVSYSLTSLLAHYMHFRITFDARRTYWDSLWRTLVIYGISMALSTMTDHWLAQQMHHRLAWFLNMGLFGLVNFFLLRYYAYYEALPKRFLSTESKEAPDA